MNTDFIRQIHENPLIQPIHTAVKGRVRYKVTGLYRSEGLKNYLESKLSREDIITQVRANPVTGNVLVIFHPDFSPKAIASLIQNTVKDYTKDIRKLALKTGQEKAKSLSQKQVKKQLDQISNQLLAVSAATTAFLLGTALLHRYGFDEAILLAIQKLHTPLLDRIMIGITLLGEPLVLLLISLGSEIALLRDNRRQEAMRLGIAATSAMSLIYLLKLFFGRARPALWDHLVNVSLHSFPSGHAMVSTVIYGFVTYILVKQFPQQQKEISALTIILIGAIGFSRLYLGVHWPTDILAGYAIGLLWLIACLFSLEVEPKYSLSARHQLSETV